MNEKIKDLKEKVSKMTHPGWYPGCLSKPESSCNCRYIFGGDDRGGSVCEISDPERTDLENPLLEEAIANMVGIVALRNDAISIIEYLEAKIAELEANHGR